MRPTGFRPCLEVKTNTHLHVYLCYGRPGVLSSHQGLQILQGFALVRSQSWNRNKQMIGVVNDKQTGWTGKLASVPSVVSQENHCYSFDRPLIIKVSSEATYIFSSSKHILSMCFFPQSTPPPILCDVLRCVSSFTQIYSFPDFSSSLDVT